MMIRFEPLRIDAQRYDAERARFGSLTPQEHSVCLLVAEGRADKDIGRRLCISAATVRHHLTSVFGKLGVASRFELILLCYRHRLVIPPVASPYAESVHRADESGERNA